MNEEAVISVAIATVILSVSFWWLTKLVAKIGLFIIPAICALVAGLVAPPRGIGEFLVIAIFTIVGVIGMLFCFLHANLYDIEHTLGELKRAENRKSKGSESNRAPPGSLMPLDDYLSLTGRSKDEVIAALRRGDLGGRQIENNWFVKRPTP